MFSTEYHPEGNAIAERGIGSLKAMISKMAYEKQRDWVKHLNMCLWAIRESPSATTGTPLTLVFGSLPKGPMSILKETWLGRREAAGDRLNDEESTYLEELLDRLQTAQQYVADHAVSEQARHVTHYNLHARDKHFVVVRFCNKTVPIGQFLLVGRAQLR